MLRAMGARRSPTDLPPGPGLGRRRELLAWIVRPEWLMEEAQRRCGDVFTLHVPAGPTVFIADPAIIKEVFADAGVFRAGEASAGFLPILGPGSTLMLDGAEHLRRRRLLLPPFHGDRLRGQQQTIVDITAAEVARWPAGETLTLAPRMRAVTLEVILRMVIGLGDGRRRDEIRERFSRLVPTGLAALLLLPAFQRELGGRSRWGRLMNDLRAIDAILYAEIADRRRAPDLGQRADVLSLLIGARAEDGSALTDQELRDELMTLLLVGHETTATTLAWTFALLFAHPHAYARLQDEVRAGGAELPYLDAVCTEVLRLRPPGPNVARQLARDATLAGHALPAGTRLAPSMYLAHRRPDSFPAPYAFRPERFLGTRPGGGWLPYGGGARRCVGAALAQLEHRLIMRTILEHATPVCDPPLAPGRPPRSARRSIVLAPAGGVPARIDPR
jgi:cytochrome P450